MWRTLLKTSSSTSSLRPNDFTQLRLKNYACFIDDAQHYAREVKEQKKGYNALMFKMRTELANTKLEAA